MRVKKGDKKGCTPNAEIYLSIWGRVQNGEFIKDLCKEFKIGRNSVYKYFKDRGTPIKSGGLPRRPYKLSKSTSRQVAEDYLSGQSCGNVAKKYGIDHRLVTSSVRRIGYKVRTLKENQEIIGDPNINSLLSVYKKADAARKYGFILSYDEFKILVTGNCYYCGQLPHRSYKNKRSDVLVNGIDRLDSKQGYHMDNVVSCCTKCNRAKNDMSLIDFKMWVEKIISWDAPSKIDKLIVDKQ